NGWSPGLLAAASQAIHRSSPFLSTPETFATPKVNQSTPSGSFETRSVSFGNFPTVTLWKSVVVVLSWHANTFNCVSLTMAAIYMFGPFCWDRSEKLKMLSNGDVY